MRKNTDLDAVKRMAKLFLHLDYKIPEELGEIGRLFLIHPVFSTCHQPLKRDGQMVLIDITEDEEGYNEVLKEMEKVFDRCHSLDAVLMYIRTPYKLSFFHYIHSMLSEEDYNHLLADVWVKSENPNMDENVSIEQSARYFKKAKKELLMEKDELDYYNALPDRLIVYRGVANGRAKHGLSWTDDEEKAIWFANRFNMDGIKGYLLEGQVKKEDILAYFNRRDESELVIYPKDITNLKKIDI